MKNWKMHFDVRPTCTDHRFMYNAKTYGKYDQPWQYAAVCRNHTKTSHIQRIGHDQTGKWKLLPNFIQTNFRHK